MASHDVSSAARKCRAQVKNTNRSRAGTAEVAVVTAVGLWRPLRGPFDVALKIADACKSREPEFISGMSACTNCISTMAQPRPPRNGWATIGTCMMKHNPDSKDLDAWRSEGNLDRMRAPVRDAIAAWALAAAFVVAIVVGPPASKGAAAGFVALHHQVLILDRELKRVSARLPSASSRAFPTWAADQSERA
jgi:hypothetical protein